MSQNRKCYMLLSAFKKYLNIKNIDIEKEESYGISFRYGGLFFIFAKDNDDPYYFRLILPKVFEINKNNKEKILETICKKSADYKAVKTFCIEADIWIAVEQFVYSLDRINDLFDRSLNVLREYFQNFREYLKDE